MKRFGVFCTATSHPALGIAQIVNFLGKESKNISAQIEMWLSPPLTPEIFTCNREKTSNSSRLFTHEFHCLVRYPRKCRMPTLHAAQLTFCIWPLKFRTGVFRADAFLGHFKDRKSNLIVHLHPSLPLYSSILNTLIRNISFTVKFFWNVFGILYF